MCLPWPINQPPHYFLCASPLPGMDMDTEPTDAGQIHGHMEPTWRATYDAEGKSDAALEYKDIEYPLFGIESLPEEDKPILTKILMILYAINYASQSAATRSLTVISMNDANTEYTVRVPFLPSDRITFEDLQCLWSASPANVVAILLSPWNDTNTNRVYFAINVVVRRAYAPMAASLLLHQKMTKQIRVNYSELCKVQDQQRHMTEAPSPSPSAGTSRRPWDVLRHAKDREVVRDTVLLCQKMTCLNGHGRKQDFWKLIDIEHDRRGAPDRIFVRWHLPEDSTVDALAAASIFATHPDMIEHIDFAMKVSHVYMEVVIFSHAATVVTMRHCTIMNYYTTQQSHRASGITLRISGPTTGTGTSPTLIGRAHTNQGPVSGQKRGRATADIDHPTPSPAPADAGGDDGVGSRLPVRKSKVARRDSGGGAWKMFWPFS